MYHLALLAAAFNAGIAIAAPAVKPWQPAAGTTWHISLTQKINPSDPSTPDVDAYDLDLFDGDAATISALQAKGKAVICYFSAGSSENWRPDFSKFQPADLGSALDGWPGENWLDVKSANVRSIMSARIDLAAQKGCNAIDPDNVDGYGNNNGLSLTQDDAVNYVNWLAGLAAAKGMATGLKNAGDIIGKVIDNIHFSVNEQCHAFSECPTYQPFITANKPVFNIEYPADAGTSSYSTSTCAGYGSGSTGFSTVVKKMDLDAWTQLCPISGVPTPAQPAIGSSPPAASTSSTGSTSATTSTGSTSPTTTAASNPQPTTTADATGDNDNDSSDTTPAAESTDSVQPSPTPSSKHHRGHHGQKSRKPTQKAQDGDDCDEDNQ
ncbi:glycoside hydrolase family 114 protein [Myriangium duriaei CBS 260.36]|uniref:alpha-galactosidase n=1 Tax=Myriangium duriaei CBS 260.36 TaxID=1168546 RepID=A0A9P4IVD4_9PEZI|nr:glycoside hydrolase family 114 protein [Myriangium duriaei CBS 260.36]